MAETTLERLELIPVNLYPSNALLDYYDAIHKLLEAITIMQGIKIKGEGAHMELIEHAARNRIINEKNRIFLQDMRDCRNRISYEGFMINGHYLRSHKETIQSIIMSLIKNLQ